MVLVRAYVYIHIIYSCRASRDGQALPIMITTRDCGKLRLEFVQKRLLVTLALSKELRFPQTGRTLPLLQRMVQLGCGMQGQRSVHLSLEAIRTGCILSLFLPTASGFSLHQTIRQQGSGMRQLAAPCGPWRDMVTASGVRHSIH